MEVFARSKTQNNQQQLMNKRYFVVLLATIFLQAHSIFGQQKFTINGYVKDGENGEELIGATVVVKELGTGTITNVYGFYAVSMPAGTYTVQYSFIGYQTVEQTFELKQNTEWNVELPGAATQMQEVVITDKPIDANVTDIKMSKNDLDIKQVKKLSKKEINE